MATAIINDDDGKLAAIAAAANGEQSVTADAAVEIEGANIKDSIHEFVQKELNEPEEELEEVSPTTKTPEEQKLLDEAKAKKDSLVEKEEDELVQTAAEKQEEERINKLVEERFDKHPRFQELNAKVHELTPLAENAKLDSQFCQQWGIAPEQKKTAMELCMLLNTQPEKALEALEKIVEDIKLNTGKLLPKDLADEVSNGTMSKERATELHMARVKLSQKDQQATAVQATAAQRHDGEIRSAINAVADTIVRTNPDFKPKANAEARDGVYELTQDKMKLLAMEKYPTTVAEAQDLLQRAYKYATSIYVPPQPQRARRTLRGTDTLSSREETNGGPKDGETMAQYVTRTVGRKFGFNANEQAA